MYRRSKIKKKGSILKNRFFWLGVGIATLAELLFYVVVLFPPFQIQEVSVKGNIEISENTIKNVVLHNLWREFLFFPTASIVIADTQGMKDGLLKALIELDTVSIQRKLPNILSVWVQEKRTVALWCPAPELPEATRCRATLNRIADGDSGSGCKDRCFSLDKEGVAFKETQMSPDFPVVTSFVTKDALFAVLDFSREMKRRSLLEDEASVSSFRIVSENQIEASASEGWSVYFTQTKDLSWQVTKLQTVLENKLPPEKRRKLEYIDVRFGDQAYIKYR